MAKKYTPTFPHLYQGNQVIINSDRLLFNAKSDSILLFADKAISFSTNGAIHFDAGKSNNPNSEFIVNAQKIILGLKPGAGSTGSRRPDDKGKGSEDESQGALLGNESIIWLDKLLDCIDELCAKLKSPANATETGPILPALHDQINSHVVSKIDDLRADLEAKTIVSKRLYIQ